VALVAGLALAAGACVGGPSPQPDSTPGTLPSHPATSSPPQPTEPFATQSDLVVGLSGEPANFNPLAAPAPADPALAAIVEAVLPSAFVPGTAQVPERNDELVTSATSTDGGPQTVTYDINPRATWSDGVAITAADFVYTWEAQSGRARFRDRGGRAYTPASTAGYRQIASVTGAAHDPDRVVVRFATPDPNWFALFSPILPAHAARAVGFDHGFTDPVTSLLSGGPFLVQSYQPGRDVLLVRNPRWWGEAANLAAIDVTFVGSGPVVTQALEQGQIGAAVTAFTPAAVAALDTVPGMTVDVSDGPTYDDLVFDERSGPLAERAVRLAIMTAVDRTALTQTAVAAGDATAAVVRNRAFPPGMAGYRDDTSVLGGTGMAGLADARHQLSAAGYTRRGSSLVRRGRSVHLTLGVDSTSPFATDESAAVVGACRALGIAVTTVGPSGGRAAMAIVQSPRAPSPAQLQSTYAEGGADNRAGYSSTVMDGLFGRLAAAASTAAQDRILDEVDSLAWTDAVDLPLLAVPRLLAFQSRYVNLTAAPTTSGIGGGAARWGIPEST
jgi:peptide/nickel transport system substrate-binding protein